jgi:hypothetical protein
MCVETSKQTGQHQPGLNRFKNTPYTPLGVFFFSPTSVIELQPLLQDCLGRVLPLLDAIGDADAAIGTAGEVQAW